MNLRSYLLFVFSLCLIHIAACQKAGRHSPSEPVPVFSFAPVKIEMNPMIAEASGIADSKKNPGYLWVEEDSGNSQELSLLNRQGGIYKTVFIKGATNRDWEDVALSNGKLYVAETGDNSQAYGSYAFYIFPEPDKSVDTISNFQKLSFRYPDGSHDAEAFLVDPTSQNIYVITKRDSTSRIYMLSAALSSGSQTARFIGQLKFNGVTSACLSPDGKEVILKTYMSLLYYRLDNGESIESILIKDPVSIPYTLEPQGEAVSFASDNSGYFTLSEKGFSSKQYLYFYKRN